MGNRRPKRSRRLASDHWDAVFDALAASRRRLVVVLLHRSNRTTVDALATKIADIEAEYGGIGSTPVNRTRDGDWDERRDRSRGQRRERKRESERDPERERNRKRGRERERDIKITLRHVHLPKLEDAELIEWDRDDDVVSLVENRWTGDLERKLIRDVATRQFERRAA